jgi:hypothetical protein
MGEGRVEPKCIRTPNFSKMKMLGFLGIQFFSLISPANSLGHPKGFFIFYKRGKNMFTGIIEDIGTVHSMNKGKSSMELSIRSEKILEDVHLGIVFQ